MSEVEALLNVDAGRIPPGAVVFRARDPESEVRRLRTVLAVTDGVWKYAGWESLLNTAVAEAGTEIIDRLRARAALPATGALQDDFTVVVLREE